jgi:hypothetical protein
MACQYFVAHPAKSSENFFFTSRGFRRIVKAPLRGGFRLDLASYPKSICLLNQVVFGIPATYPQRPDLLPEPLSFTSRSKKLSVPSQVQLSALKRASLGKCDSSRFDEILRSKPLQVSLFDFRPLLIDDRVPGGVSTAALVDNCLPKYTFKAKP